MNKTGKEIFQYGLGFVVVVCFFLTLILTIFNAIPEQNIDSVNILLGVSGTMTVGVLNYFYSSTKGSADKTEHMVAMAAKPTPISTPKEGDISPDGLWIWKNGKWEPKPEA